MGKHYVVNFFELFIIVLTYKCSFKWQVESKAYS